MSAVVVLEVTAPVVDAVEGRVSVPLLLAFPSTYFFVFDALLAAAVSIVVAAAVVKVSVQIEVVPLASAQLLTKKRTKLKREN